MPVELVAASRRGDSHDGGVRDEPAGQPPRQAPLELRDRLG